MDESFAAALTRQILALQHVLEQHNTGGELVFRLTLDQACHWGMLFPRDFATIPLKGKIAGATIEVIGRQEATPFETDLNAYGQAVMIVHSDGRAEHLPLEKMSRHKPLRR